MFHLKEYILNLKRFTGLFFLKADWLILSESSIKLGFYYVVVVVSIDLLKVNISCSSTFINPNLENM